MLSWNPYDTSRSNHHKNEQEITTRLRATLHPSHCCSGWGSAKAFADADLLTHANRGYCLFRILSKKNGVVYDHCKNPLFITPLGRKTKTFHSTPCLQPSKFLKDETWKLESDSVMLIKTIITFCDFFQFLLVLWKLQGCMRNVRSSKMVRYQ